MAFNGLYAPHIIRPGYGEFRLLCIDPASDRDAPLQGHLRVASLRERPNYATLSYCWGDQTNKRRLELDCYSLNISSGLDTALRSFRALRVRVVWVDQICINQQDVDERNAQILMMKDIYVCSSECFVYLGESSGDPDELALLINYVKIYRGDSGMQDQVLHIYEEVLKLKEDRRVAEDISEDSGWRKWRGYLFNIISRSYFSRIWVLQELIFSKKVTCLLGSFAFSWDIVDSFAKDLPIREALSATPAFKSMPSIVVSKRSIVEEADRLTTSDGGGRALTLEQFSSFIDLIDSLRESHSEFRSQTLFSLLIASRSFKVTDPRDKIFALLNLAADKGEFPNPNYSWTRERVYRKFARTFLRQGQTVEILALTGLQISALSGYSWVPDWRQVSLSWNFQAYSTFKAGGPKRSLFLETNTGGLIIPGMRIDCVKVVCPFAVEELGLTPKMLKMIEDATDAILEQQLAGLEHRYFIDESLVSLLFCDYTGDLQRNRAVDDFTKLRLCHTLEVLIEKVKGMGVIEKCEQRDKSERFGVKRPFYEDITFLQTLDAAEMLPNSFAAGPRSLRRNVLSLLPLERRVKEATIKAIRSKGIDYVKYLHTIDKSTRIIVTENGRLG
jgi:hypothetical protein